MKHFRLCKSTVEKMIRLHELSEMFLCMFFSIAATHGRPCSSIVTIHPLIKGDNESKRNSAALLHVGAKRQTTRSWISAPHGNFNIQEEGLQRGRHRAHGASKHLVVNSNQNARPQFPLLSLRRISITCVRFSVAAIYGVPLRSPYSSPHAPMQR